MVALPLRRKRSYYDFFSILSADFFSILSPDFLPSDFFLLSALALPSVFFVSAFLSIFLSSAFLSCATAVRLATANVAAIRAAKSCFIGFPLYAGLFKTGFWRSPAE